MDINKNCYKVVPFYNGIAYNQGYNNYGMCANFFHDGYITHYLVLYYQSYYVRHLIEGLKKIIWTSEKGNIKNISFKQRLVSRLGAVYTYVQNEEVEGHKQV